MTHLRTYFALLLVGALSCSIGCSGCSDEREMDRSTGFFGQTVQECQADNCRTFYCSMILGESCGGGAGHHVVVNDCDRSTSGSGHVQFNGGNITITETHNGSQETVQIGGGGIHITETGGSFVSTGSNTVIVNGREYKSNGGSSTVIVNGREYKGHGSSNVIINNDQTRHDRTTTHDHTNTNVTHTTDRPKDKVPNRGVLFN